MMDPDQGHFPVLSHGNALQQSSGCNVQSAPLGRQHTGNAVSRVNWHTLGAQHGDGKLWQFSVPTS
jgi:hypothetical protein